MHHSSSLAPGPVLPLFDAVRHQLQRSLATPIRVQPAGNQEAAYCQLWQIGAAPGLLVRPAPTGPGVPPLPTDARTLLLYEYVPARLGRFLRAQGIHYADAAGNVWLQHPPLLLGVQGLPRPAPPGPVAGMSRRVDLLRLLFHLLHEAAPAACSDARLADQTGLALPVVQRERQRLLVLGLWPADLAGSWPTAAAAQFWLAGFAACLRQRLGAQRYCLRNADTWRDWPHVPPPGSWWGSEPAARLLLGQPEAPTTYTLYTRQPRPQLVRHLGLLPHPQGRIEILNAFLPRLAAPSPPGCVPALLAYADLATSTHPGLTTLAQQLHEHFFACGLTV